MMKKIKFKKKFENKLETLGVLDKFIENIINLNKGEKFHNILDIIENLDNPENWGFFIEVAFPWKESLEGFEFWKNISENEL